MRPFASSTRGIRIPARMLRLAPFLALSLCVHAGVLLPWKPQPEVRAAAGAALTIELVAPVPAVKPAPAPPAPAAAALATAPSKSRTQVEGRQQRHAHTKADARKRQQARPGPAQPAPASRRATADAPRRAAQAARAAARPPLPAAANPRPAASARAPAADATNKSPAAPLHGQSVPADATSSPAARVAQPGTERHASVSQEQTRARLRELLLADVARHFEYPWIARRRGWQGMVRLSVTVRPDGALERIRVTRSSGYEVLDRSAVETMERVGHLAYAGHWLDGRALELPLAIVYRLTD